MSKKRALAVVDTESGELISDGSVSIRHKSQDEGYKKAMIKHSDGRHWIASYHGPINDVAAELSLTDAGAIFKMLPYIHFKTGNTLIKDGKPLSQADIQRLLGRGKTATRSIIRSLEDKGVISVSKQGRSNVYRLSEDMHGKGTLRAGDKFTKLYQVRARDIAASLTLVEAGILYKILPFFHYAEFYLVSNPDEEDARKLRYIGRNELAGRIGMREQDLTQAVRKLRSKGALMTTQSKNTLRYLVHPDVMYRQSTNTDWADAVRKMFGVHAV